ncbi:MAG: hypothetical protein KF809_18745, partial [Chloroflexi bacterium]|nr:hypothetical protein [Chloroflexota bacterium]
QDQRVRLLGGRLATAGERTLRTARRDLDAERRALEASRPGALLAAERERAGLLLDRATRAITVRITADMARLQGLGERLPGAVGGQLGRARADLDRQEGALRALGPWATLERGYAIARDGQGSIIRDPSELAVGDAIEVRVARGTLDARVEAVRDSTT